MPYQCLHNQELYMDSGVYWMCVIVEVNVILLGDFNGDVNTLFETELMAMNDILNLTISDYIIFGRFSGQLILPPGSTISFVVRMRMHFIMFFYVCACVYDLYLMCVCACLFFFVFFFYVIN